ncbi:MAG: choice-of-anchor D domain-containing protein [Ignavibacteria bacterium]|nr:choice-of-anchor D domain-containing protein [Ignavibacteria bacterium]
MAKDLSKSQKPIIAKIESIEFDTVIVKKTKEMSVEITNEGDGDLVVTKLELLGDKVFNLKGVSLPITVAAGGKTSISVVFAPIAQKNYTTFLQITSNSNNEVDNAVTVSLSGSGKESVGVFTPAEEATTIIAMSAGPNPSADKSVLSYTVGGAVPQLVELYIVNSLGQRVAEIGSQLHSPGNYTAGINAANLASGSYRIVAHTAVETVQLPFVVNR